MKKLWLLFWALCLLITLMLGWRLWNIRMLYTDASIREKTKMAIELIAEEEGWFISDIALRVVYPTGIIFHHRQHTRGRDPEQCFLVSFEPVVAYLPCDL